MSDNKSVLEQVDITAPPTRVWEVITSPEYAKILGSEFDKNAYVESDWKPGSKVYFKYAHAPDKPANTGTITHLVQEECIQVDYRFYLFWKYSEKYVLKRAKDCTVLQIDAGPYGSDAQAHRVVWRNWLLKVKTLSESYV